MDQDPVVADGDSPEDVYSDALELAFDAIKKAEKQASSISKVDTFAMAGLWTQLSIAVELRKAMQLLATPTSPGKTHGVDYFLRREAVINPSFTLADAARYGGDGGDYEDGAVVP
jgi:hypothetical protein